MTISASTRCRSAAHRSQFSALSVAPIVFALVVFTFSSSWLLVAQVNSEGAATIIPPAASKGIVSGPTPTTLSLAASSTMNVASEMGGAFKSGSKCDAEGNLYIPKFALDRPLLGPVVKIDPDGKPTARFDPSAFSKLALHRADGFSPASDGGLYQIAESENLQDGVSKRRIYVLHFSSDGSPSSPTLLDADFEVYTFAAFAGGNFLVSGVHRDLQKNAQNNSDQGRNFSAVFSADGRELAELSFKNTAVKDVPGNSKATAKTPVGTDAPSPTLDLADAEVGSDGNLYVMRSSAPAVIYVISPSGEIMKTLKIAVPLAGAIPNTFHISGNRMALSYATGESQTFVVVDAQTGKQIASYGDPGGLGPSFACYSANDGVFTFLKLGEANELEVIRAAVQ